MSADPDPDERRPPKLYNAWFWAALLFALACVLAGAGVAFFGPRLFPPAAPRGPAAATSAAAGAQERGLGKGAPHR